MTRTAVLRPRAPLAAPAWSSARSWRKSVSALLLSCLIGLAGLTAGLIIAEGLRDDGVPPGARLATPEEVAAARPALASEPADAADTDPADPDPAAGEAQASARASDGASAPSQQPPADQPWTDSQRPPEAALGDSEASDGTPETAYPAPLPTEEPAVAVARTVGPSVVRIEVQDEFASGLGSGIVWDAENGYVVTNQHVVEGVTEVTVSFSDGVHVEGKVIGGSAAHDVAVVQVDPGEANLVEAVLAPTSSVEVGQLAIAIGSPFGLTGTVTAGIVSAVRIQVQGGADPNAPVPVEMIQTDAAINRGNSGGALVDWRGRVIGMNTLIQTTTGGSIGLGFAVPSDTVELIALRIVRGESLELGYLGISSAPGDSDVVGVTIETVSPGSAAEAAGLLAGDEILAIDDEPMRDIAELSAAVKLRRPGDEVKLTVKRGDEVLVFEVRLGSPE